MNTNSKLQSEDLRKKTVLVVASHGSHENIIPLPSSPSYAERGKRKIFAVDCSM